MLNLKKYQNHIFGCDRNSISLMSQIDHSNVDRNYMEMQMKSHIDYLDQNNVTQYSNFSKTFKSYGLRAEEEKELLKLFQESHHSLFLLKPRELNKANSGERNLLFNRIALQFQGDFIIHVQEYVKQKHLNKIRGFMKENDQVKLILEIKNLISYLTNQNVAKIRCPQEEIDFSQLGEIEFTQQEEIDNNLFVVDSNPMNYDFNEEDNQLIYTDFCFSFDFSNENISF
ncbi:hypothetical protein M9Y10_007307 [Tritrichomonas musculus]|uniref:Uncharacterized protein n=1 Tax=Tritrichomonas musculus TaxID=1915356 RepID=A0ABR2J1Z3_9EUKA